MCYDVAYQIEKLEKYARHRGLDEDEIAKTVADLKEKMLNPTPAFHHLSGFQFGPLPVYTNEDPFSLQFYTWGLIPKWSKTMEQAKKIRAGTLNARCETLFEKASFKNAVKNNRCLIMIDGFYEYHHLKGRTYPFYIYHIDNKPLMLAGIYEKAIVDGKEMKTVSIVTTKANSLMAKIHNNPKLDEPRMPVILRKEHYDFWLYGEANDEVDNEIDLVYEPYPSELLKAHTVRKLKEGRIPLNEENSNLYFFYQALPLGVDSIPESKNGGQLELL